MENAKIKKLLKAIIDGSPCRYAFRMFGLSDAYFFKIKNDYEKYLKEARAGLNDGKQLLFNCIKIEDSTISISGTPSTVQLWAAVLQAEALTLKGYLDNLKSDEKYNRWAFLLERQFKEVYSKERYQEETINNVEAIKIVFTSPKSQNSRLEKLTNEVLEAVKDDKRIA